MNLVCGQSIERQNIERQSIEGQSFEGQSIEGQSIERQSIEGIKVLNKCYLTFFYYEQTLK